MTCTSNPKSPTRDRSPSPKQSSSVSLRTLPQPASQHLLPHAISATEVGRRGNRRCCRRSRTCFGKIEKLLPGTKVDSWHPRHWKHPHQRRKGGKGHSIPSFIIRSPHSGIHISSLVFPSDPDPSQTSKWTSQPSPSLTPLAPLPVLLPGLIFDLILGWLKFLPHPSLTADCNFQKRLRDTWEVGGPLLWDPTSGCSKDSHVVAPKGFGQALNQFSETGLPRGSGSPPPLKKSNDNGSNNNGSNNK